jgi:two-component system sensor histidine kinase HydH
MSTQDWITLIACVGELAVAALVFLRALGSPLAMPLLLFSVDLVIWNFARLAYQRTGAINWHLVDMVASPIGTALAFLFLLRFVGRARKLRWVLTTDYVLNGILSATAALALVSPVARAITLSKIWSCGFLLILFLPSGLVIKMLLAHLRSVGSVEERSRTLLLLVGVVVISPLASSEIFADMGFNVPRLASVGILSFNAILLVAALRFRLFDRKLSASTVLSATVLATVGGLAYLSVFHISGSNTALLVLGTLTVTLILFAAGRLIIGTIIVRRDQLVRFAALGKMAAQMAHDLKNPLAALKGAAQFLREEMSQGRSIDSRTDFIDLLVEQIDRLKSAVEKYQRLGRIEAMRAPVQLNELVQSLVTLQEMGNSAQNTVKAELAADLPECPLDRDLVAGALENLLQNAFEATPHASMVTVRTALSHTRHAQAVMLSVEDVGIGMSARTRERALDDFYTTKATGSGLGLAFVRRVAEAHGGEVSLTSKEGAGTTVRLFLPLE